VERSLIEPERRIVRREEVEQKEQKNNKLERREILTYREY
jgi:hypothetical protein